MGKKSKTPGGHINEYHKKMKKKSIKRSKDNQEDRKYEKHVIENPELIRIEMKKLQGQRKSKNMYRLSNFYRILVCRT